jgi:hypothetical protein
MYELFNFLYHLCIVAGNRSVYVNRLGHQAVPCQIKIFIIFVNVMEDILERGGAHFVAQNPKIWHIHFKICEKILQIYVLRNSEGDFG